MFCLVAPCLGWEDLARSVDGNGVADAPDSERAEVAQQGHLARPTSAEQREHRPAWHRQVLLEAAASASAPQRRGRLLATPLRRPPATLRGAVTVCRRITSQRTLRLLHLVAGATVADIEVQSGLVLRLPP